MPYYKGIKAVSMYIRNITKEDREKERVEVLNTKVEDIKGYAEVVRNTMSQDYLAVVGNEKEIKENKDIFKNLINVLK